MHYCVDSQSGRGLPTDFVSGSRRVDMVTVAEQISMICFSGVYSFISKDGHLRFVEPPLWPNVRCQLECLLGCLPFFFVQISPFPGIAPFMRLTRPDDETAVVQTISKPPVLRHLGRLAERGGWLLHDELCSSAVARALERRLIGFLEETGLLGSLKPSRPVEVHPE